MHCARRLLLVGLLVSLGLQPARAGDKAVRVSAPPPAPPSRHAISFEDWKFWCHANADRLEAEVAGTRRLDGWEVFAVMRASILDTLRALVGRQATLHPFVAAQAVRALARATDSGADASVIAGLLVDPAADHLVREAAALGLGMLRRTHPRHALTQGDTERVPSLVPLYESVQHRAMTDLTNELMGTP